MEHVTYTHVGFGILAMAIALGVLYLFKEPKAIPQTAGQVLLEGYLNFVRQLLVENIGKEGLKYVPLVASLGLFIFFGNLFTLIPGFDSPTANLNTTLALGLIVFFYYNWEGIRKHGVGYIKHFLGPIPWLAPLFFVIEVISHIARPITLALRLFANMRGGSLILLVITSLLLSNWLTTVISPPILWFLILIKILAVFIQTFVFMILTVIYLAGAVAEEAH
ncbi:MAG: ATP synthase F0 subunit A [Gammaproteobacteria bacterium]|nr:MAG: ATP synthase F0 subunit A [Gammaproteobacteria bacterium]